MKKGLCKLVFSYFPSLKSVFLLSFYLPIARDGNFLVPLSCCSVTIAGWPSSSGAGQLISSISSGSLKHTGLN